MISFLIVNWNGGAIFQECIASVSENMRAYSEPYEIVVVDNASSDLDDRFLEANGVRLITNERNLLFAKATNQTVHASVGDVIIVMNNDIILTPNSVRELMALHRDHSQEVVCTALLGADGKLQRSIRNLPTPMSVLLASFGLHLLSHRFDQWFLRSFDYSRASYVEQPMFAFLVMSRATWEAVGDMDEQFPLLFNDVDWFHRAMSRGLRTYYSPNPRVFHVQGYSVNRHRYKKVVRSTVGMYRFFCKNTSNDGAAMLWAVVVCSISFCTRIILETIQLIRG